MFDLHINLPKVDAAWAESHLTELSVKGVEEFRCRDKAFWCDVFAERYERLAGHTSDLRQQDVDLRVLRKIPTAVESAFKEHGIWEKQIVDAAGVETYNQALQDAIDMIAELYAQSWASELRCKAWWK